MCTYTQKIKKILLTPWQNTQNNLIELYTLLKLNAKYINIANLYKYNIYINSDNYFIIKQIITVFNKTFKVKPILIYCPNKTKKYTICITPNMLNRNELNNLLLDKETNLTKMLINTENYRAFIRACFLSNAGISDPDKSYNVTFYFSDIFWCKALQRAFNKFNINSNISKRGNNSIIYIKEAESIVNLLNIIGANKELFEFENLLLIREVRSNINRVVNFETANLNRTVNTSIKQINDIKFIDEKIGIDSLDEPLYQVAKLRLKYENASLKELAAYCVPNITKSGLNHRLKKLSDIADNLRNNSGGNYEN